jgi:hypothetical protein
MIIGMVTKSDRASRKSESASSPPSGFTIDHVHVNAASRRGATASLTAAEELNAIDRLSDIADVLTAMNSRFS